MQTILEELISNVRSKEPGTAEKYMSLVNSFQPEGETQPFLQAIEHLGEEPLELLLQTGVEAIKVVREGNVYDEEDTRLMSAQLTYNQGMIYEQLAEINNFDTNLLLSAVREYRISGSITGEDYPLDTSRANWRASINRSQIARNKVRDGGSETSIHNSFRRAYKLAKIAIFYSEMDDSEIAELITRANWLNASNIALDAYRSFSAGPKKAVWFKKTVDSLRTLKKISEGENASYASQARFKKATTIVHHNRIRPFRFDDVLLEAEQDLTDLIEDHELNEELEQRGQMLVYGYRAEVRNAISRKNKDPKIIALALNDYETFFKMYQDAPEEELAHTIEVKQKEAERLAERFRNLQREIEEESL